MRTKTILWSALTLLALGGLMGCKTLNKIAPVPHVPDYTPRNVYTADLPKTFIRVALLPMHSQGDFGLQASLDNIAAGITSELVKAKKFEVIPLSRDELKHLSGKETLSSQEKWPYALKKELQERQIDGVMLVELTYLRGYQPVAMGIKMRLVDINTGKTYWAVEDMLDSANPSIFKGAKEYEEGMLFGRQSSSVKAIASIQQSPGLFGRYVGALLFKTLP